MINFEAKNGVMFILYIKDQQRSKGFYEDVLGFTPNLDVPGMTEFILAENVILGIMPGDGIVRVLEDKISNPNLIQGLPRCEVYLYVDDPDIYYDRVIKAGGQGISRGSIRNWGDYVAYCSDFDGNILAFAKKE